MRRAVLMSAVLALLVPGSVGAATREVLIADNSFSPRSIRIAVGDLVRWKREGDAFGDHNVRQFRRSRPNQRPLFYSGAPTSNPAFVFRRRFSAGEFGYKCDLHGPGMSGVVNVPVTIGRAPAGLNFGVRWANGRTNTGTRFDVQFRVGSGRWRAWRSDTKTKARVFGRRGRPVQVANGKRYSFRARSQKKKSESNWSPVRSFRP
jgi:plastocyanin